MSVDPELEYQYNNMARRPDAPELLQSFAALSTAYRNRADCELDCEYGDNDREKLDVFRSGKSDAPLLVYLHGGYWQRGDKSIYSFLADSFNQAGVDVAIVGYPLCPAVSMSAITASITRALAWLYLNAATLGLCADRINLCGHSAGGHLTAMGMTVRWPEINPALPADLLKSTIPISGLYRLQPLQQTTISEVLHITGDELISLSPVLLHKASMPPMLCVVGGVETHEFFRQVDDLIEHWTEPGFIVEKHIETAADHFDVVERLASADSDLFQRAVNWLK